MITKGNICNFSFYVAGYDPKTGEAYNEPVHGLSLEQAKEEFAKQCADSPMSIDVALGVEFTTDRADLEPTRRGGAELLRRINGRLDNSEDYRLSQVLSREKLISVNAVRILNREAERLQKISDNATMKCAMELNENALRINGKPEETEQFISELAEKYGADRIKSVLANELLGGYGIAGEEAVEYLKNNYDEKYDERYSLFMSAEQIEEMSGVMKKVEGSLTEIQSKLKNSGLVFGNAENIRAKSTEIATEIEHHNELEDRGQAADDELSL